MLRKKMKFKERKSWYASIFIHLTDYIQDNKCFCLCVCLNLFQSVSENLLQELNRFVDAASQQRARLEASQTSAVTDVAFDCVGILM